MPNEPKGMLDVVKEKLTQERLGSYETDWNTPLSQAEEAQYQKYKKALGDRGDDTYYDLRGYWLKYGKEEDIKKPEAHFTDEFKKPTYATFSKDSKYHNSINPDGSMNVGGEWVGDSKFIPSPEMWGDENKKKSLLQHQKNESMDSISTGKGFEIQEPTGYPTSAVDHVKQAMKAYGITK